MAKLRVGNEEYVQRHLKKELFKQSRVFHTYLILVFIGMLLKYLQKYRL